LVAGPGGRIADGADETVAEGSIVGGVEVLARVIVGEPIEAKASGAEGLV